MRNGWKRAEPVPELEQVLVVDREERSLQRREHRQLVVGPLDRGQRRANRLDFFAVVKRLAADEQVRNAARLDRVDVRPRRRPRRSSRTGGTGRRCAAAGSARVARRRPAPRSATGQPFCSSTSQAMNAPTASGSDSSMALADAFSGPAAGVRPRHRQRDDRRLRLVGGAMRRQRHVAGLQRQLVGGHLRRERRVDEPLDRRHAAVARRQLQHASAAALELPADAPVGADVGAAEPVDRLLRIADDEQLAGHGRDVASSRSPSRIVGRQQQQDLGLDRIGVLELVDEDPRELRLQMPPDVASLSRSDRARAPADRRNRARRPPP